MDALQVLVIVLSVFLALFLLAAIILTVLLIKVTLEIKKVAKTAQFAADSLSSMVTDASRLLSPAMLGKFIYNQIRKFRK